MASVGLAVLEIRLSFPNSVDDDVVSFFPYFVFLLLLLHPIHLYVSLALIWRVFAIVWVCNFDAILCYYFYYCYDIEC